jgi:hypothetical protein
VVRIVIATEPRPLCGTKSYKSNEFVALGDKPLITVMNAADEFVSWIHNTINNSDGEVFPSSDPHEAFTLTATLSEKRIYFSALSTGLITAS